VTPQFGASLTDGTSSIIYNRNVLIKQATGTRHCHLDSLQHSHLIAVAVAGGLAPGVDVDRGGDRGPVVGDVGFLMSKL
jgi:hypothetical protein